jgi:hypothetical protein
MKTSSSTTRTIKTSAAGHKEIHCGTTIDARDNMVPIRIGKTFPDVRLVFPTNTHVPNKSVKTFLHQTSSNGLFGKDWFGT